jgi:hypothetical protein
MKTTAELCEKIRDCLPVQRGNVRLTNLQILNAFLYLCAPQWRECGLRLSALPSDSNRMSFLLGEFRAIQDPAASVCFRTMAGSTSLRNCLKGASSLQAESATM